MRGTGGCADALRGRSHTRQHILFNQQIALIIPSGEASQHRGKVHRALSQFTEDTVAQGCEVVPSCGAGLGCEVRVAVLQVDVPDAFTESLEGLQHVGAARAIGVVAGVENKTELRGIGALQQRGDFVGRFDVSGTVVVEHGAQTRFRQYRVGDRLRARGKHFPFGRAQPVLRRDPTGALSPSGHRSVVVREDQIGGWTGRNRGQQTSGLHGALMPSVSAAAFLRATGTKAPSMTRPRWDSSPRNTSGSVGI